MNNLIVSDFRRLFKSKLTYFALLGFIVLSLIDSNTAYVSDPGLIQSFGFGTMMYVSLFTGVVTSVTICEDIQKRTVINKLSAGRTRGDIYFSKYIVCLTVNALFSLINLVRMLMPVIKGYGDLKTMLFYSLAAFVSSSAMCALLTGTAFLSGKTYVSLVLTLVLFFSLTALSGRICGVLNIQKEYKTIEYEIDAVDISDSDTASVTSANGSDGVRYKLVTKEDPNYVGGKKRTFLTVFNRLNPESFLLDTSEYNISLYFEDGIKDSFKDNIEKDRSYPVYALISWIVFTFTGYFLFRKKDIK